MEGVHCTNAGPKCTGRMVKHFQPEMNRVNRPPTFAATGQLKHLTGCRTECAQELIVVVEEYTTAMPLGATNILSRLTNGS